MITLAEPKMLKSQNMTMLGLKLLPNNPESLTQQRFRTFSQGDHLSARFNQHDHALFAKVIKCVSLSILVIILGNKGAMK